MEKSSQIKELAREKREGKSYAEIRASLEASGMSDEEIRNLLRKVDKEVLKFETEQQFNQQAKLWHRGGMILAVTGLVISIAFNAGLILNRFPPWVVYSPFFAGILLMFYGRMQQRKKPEPKQGPGPIRKKRPYK